MKVIAITAGIACGKTTVSNYLMELGYLVIDADLIAHDLLYSNKDIANKIKDSFGDNVINSDGTINRAKLGELVFGNAENLEILNGITHPKIKDRIRELIKINSDKDILFLDIPLLFEAHFDDLCDESWLIYVDRDTQIKRLQLRDNLSLEQCIKRLSSQMPIEDKIPLANKVIDNRNSFDFTKKQIDELLK